MRTQFAFSLLELLLVLALIAILAGLSIPGLQSLASQTDANWLHTELWTLLQMAKQQARMRKLPITLCPSNDQINCQMKWQDSILIFIDDLGKVKPLKQSDILFVTQTKKEKGMLHWQGFPNKPYLSYFPYGEREMNGTFWYCLKGQNKPVWAIIINPLLRERSMYPDDNGDIKDSKGKILSCLNHK